MKFFVLALLLAGPAAHAGGPAGSDTFSLSADQWSAPRSGAALVKLAPIHEAVADWLGDTAARIVIVHAGTDTGNLWAGEVQDWLVALGIPADHIQKQASADQSDGALTLEVRH
ncbi:MAG TPA: hypothetical protein VLV87_03700 [Gammaproteobacteria bacterium]|nr:hypothetical protein [Gammaproteobacteria bacterium]